MPPDPARSPNDDAPVQRCRIRYRGHVQGVGFRATTQRLARRRPLTGWVRNEPDGSVLMEAQGPAAHVQGLLDDLREAMLSHITDEHRTDLSPHDADALRAAGEHDFAIHR